MSSFKGSRQVKDRLSLGGTYYKAGERARTKMGPQGDHVSAYALIVRAVERRVEGKDLGEAIEALTELMYDQVLPSMSAEDQFKHRQTIDSIISQIENNISLRAETDMYMHEDLLFFTEKVVRPGLEALAEEESAKGIALFEKAKRAIQVSNNVVLLSIVNDLIKNQLTLRNQFLFTSFPREGNVEPPPGEPSRIHNAIGVLDELADKISQNSLRARGPMRAQKEIAQLMYELIWYPKIDELTYDLSSDEGKQLWDEVVTSKRYNKGTVPRDNNLDTLYDVVAQHILLVMDTYPEFHQLDVDNIIINFIDKMACSGSLIVKEQVEHTRIEVEQPFHWEMDEDVKNLFLDQVLTRLPLEKWSAIQEVRGSTVESDVGISGDGVEGDGSGTPYFSRLVRDQARIDSPSVRVEIMASRAVDATVESPDSVLGSDIEEARALIETAGLQAAEGAAALPATTATIDDPGLGEQQHSRR